MRQICGAALIAVMLAACTVRTSSPSDQDGKALLERKLEQIFVPPFSLDSFAKTDGRSRIEAGTETYQMDFTAVVKYTTDDIRCVYPYCPQLSSSDLHALFDKTKKTVSIKGQLTFEKTKDGWVGQL
jgi:hypothetical protein